MQQLQQVRAVAAQNPMLVGKATLDVIVSVPEKPEPSEAEDVDAVLAEPVAVATLKMNNRVALGWQVQIPRSLSTQR
ncbi:hypothetical protein KRP22_014266 [Phytophthora ramorum]|nr:hypothetical protein KRP22_9134 [Phytophthora ramorum]